MYAKSGGKCTNLTVYYCLPGQPLDSGIRKLEGDKGILDLIRAYKGENEVPIFIEESSGPLLIIGPDGNIIEPHDDMLALPHCDQTNHPIDLDEQYDVDSENQFTKNIDVKNPDNENNVNEEGVCENIDIENPLTENPILENVFSRILDTENSNFENLGAENQFTENIDIENPDNENNVNKKGVSENIEIENPLTENSVVENLVVDLNNEFEDGAWASVSDESGQNEERVGIVNEDGYPQEGRVEAQLEEQEVQRRVNEDGWYSDAEEENVNDLDALRDYKYIRKRIQHFIKDNPNEGLESLKNKIRRDVQDECSMHKVYNAKRYALELLRGDAKEQYNRLYDYCATVVKHNPNSSMVLKVDRSLTPPGLCKRQLLTVVERDWNDNLAPIAYAMVEVEKFDTWEWAEHRFCLRHMYNNFKATFKGVELKQLFWKAASTYNLIGQARELPFIEMFEWVRTKCINRIQIKRQGMEKYAGIYYSCGMFQLVGYPCCHVVASIASLRLDIENYVDDCFKKEIYLRVYSHMVNSVPGIHDFEKSVFETIDPPHIRNLPGRPRKVRKRDGNDIRGPSVSRKGLTYTCSISSEQGHNKSGHHKHTRQSQMPPQSATNHSTVNPPPQSETGTSTEMLSASQLRRQVASQPVRNQTVSQSRAKQPTWRPTGASASNQMPFVASQPVRRQSASQPMRRQSASQPVRRQTATKTSNASTSAQVPTFSGQATIISNSEGPPIPTQSQSSQIPQQVSGQSHKSIKQANSASLSSRKLQKMKQIMELSLPNYADFYVWVGGNSEWIPTVSSGSKTATKTSNASTSAQLPTQPRRKSASQPPTTQTAPRFRSASQVPTFSGQATIISNSEGPPIPTQSQSSQIPQQVSGQSHKSIKQANPASLSSRKLQKMKQVLNPTLNPAF
ncbi:hypothetical protein BUALT_Bualt04G0009500 [Buddleja alternifolia]|uniref:SWIM-type domain-containing protein n=1 Tax=Buddleja alternifolia TaxID=168488 RepID=A0AAV6XTF8_9LAMI|nr:hypothetical protein BUALT_Bualt04G0009500 [Buddleja alternifolia]